MTSLRIGFLYNLEGDDSSKGGGLWPPAQKGGGLRPPPLCGLLCGYVAMWLCGSVAMWLWLCSYVAMWLGGPLTPQHSDAHPCTRPPSWGTQ